MAGDEDWPEADEEELPPSRLRGSEIRYTYLVGAFATICAAILLADHTGKGAPKHVDLVWAVLGLVGGVGLAVSARWRNRMVTASVALLTGFVVGQAKGPTVLSGVTLAGFLAPAVFALLLYIRQSRADRARRTAARGASRAASRTRVEPAGPERVVAGGRGRPTGRYTPPKDRTPPPPKGRRRSRS